VSQSLGHSAIGVTDAIYVHLRDEAKREKADRLDHYLQGVINGAVLALTGPKQGDTDENISTPRSA